jgi:uncharacterized membrane protein YgcG
MSKSIENQVPTHLIEQNLYLNQLQMKKAIILLMLSIITLGIHAQKETSKWVDHAIIVDGLDTIGDERPGKYDSSSGILYDVRNDLNCMYLSYEFTDVQKQQKLILSGFEIEIMVKSKPKMKGQIVFHKLKPEDFKSGEEKRGQGRGNRRMGSTLPDELKNNYILKATFADVFGFRKTQGQIIRNDDRDQDFTYHFGWKENGNLLLEIKIPLDELFEEELPYSDIVEKKLQIESKLKGMQKPSMSQGGRPGGQRGGGGQMGGRSGGSRMGGGRPGGGRSGMDGQQSQMMEMFQDDVIKMKLRLAEAK